MSLEEDTLWDTRVFDLWFIDVDGVVIEEVVDLALSGSEVFVGIFNDWLNKVSVKYELLYSNLLVN